MPDLILMDAMMDEMNGFEAMSLILKLQSTFKPPMLMLTASNDEAIINMAFEHGATDFIPKPVNLHVLKNGWLIWFARLKPNEIYTSLPTMIP